MSTQFCPQCGTARLGSFRFCRTCRFDFDSEADIAASDASGGLLPTIAEAPSIVAETTSFPAPAIAGGSAVSGSGRLTKRRIVVGSVVALLGLGAIGSALGAPGSQLPTPSMPPVALSVAQSSPMSRSTSTPIPTPLATPAATPVQTPTPTVAPTAAPIKYAKLTSRDWSKVVKAPDNYTGKGYLVWACISQFDAATGTDSFRGEASYKNQEYWYSDSDNVYFSGTTSQLADFVQDDVVYMKVLSLGSFSYDTQIGGNTTVPLFEVVSISRKGSCA